MSLRDKVVTVEANLREALKNGEISENDINSNFIEFWYWKKFNNITILIDGQERGLGYLSHKLESGETVRTVWSKIRHEKDKKMEQEYKQVFSNKS